MDISPHFPHAYLTKLYFCNIYFSVVS